MLSDREDELQKEIKSREAKAAQAAEDLQAAREQLNAAAGKEKELNDKLKQKNAQLAQLGKERGDLVQELAKARTILAKVGGAEEAAAAVEEQFRATKAMQDQVVALEAEVAKSKDAASVIGGKLDTAEKTIKDLTKQAEELEAQMTDALDAKMKVDSQLSEMLRNSGDRDQHEKQMAMLKADRDAHTSKTQTTNKTLTSTKTQLSKIHNTYNNIIHNHNKLKTKIKSLNSDAQMAEQASQLSNNWEACPTIRASKLNNSTLTLNSSQS